MPLEIIRNDITKVTADAIVNTANPKPVIGAGTDSAIHRAAGPELLEARKQIGEILPGACAETPAFGLMAKYVLHTVGPAWIDGAHREQETLRSAYDAALNAADRLGCASVAFPLMASGSYGFPHDIALRVAIQAFTDFLMTHEMQIILVIFSKEAVALSGSLFGGLKSYIDDNYVAAANADEYRDGYRRRRGEIRYSIEPNMANARPVRPAATDAASDAAPHRPEKTEPADIASSLSELLKTKESSFSEYVLELLAQKHEKDSTVYHRAQISRQLFNKIINEKDYQPKKNTAIQLAIGLELDLEQTQKLLGKAGYALTRSSKTDLAVQYYIERGFYNLVEINIALYDCGLPPLVK
ncbi:MAG: macro domain-containing protein [Oscillospiraceae bacterium]|nr:macro domain-containing protein [Oscillospiraceae bacterium]